MILVFLIFTIFLIFAVLTATIKLDVQEIFFSNMEDEVNNRFKTRFLIYFKIYIFNKIRVLKIKIDKNKLMQMNVTKQLKNIDIYKLQKNKSINKENLKAIKKLKIKTEKLKINVDVGVNNVVLTSTIVTIISTLIATLITKTIDKFERDKYYFCVMPKYINRSVLKIDIEGIISFKVVHIIYIIYYLIKMRSEEKDGRTSDRRSYDYSYE